MTGIGRTHLWSGPRNISTALMYSFAQRSDTQVVDEPLYAHYLKVSGARHPGREDVLAAQENDGRNVITQILGNDFTRPHVFFKQMTHHLAGLDDTDKLRLLRGATAHACRTSHILLVRDPRAVLISYSKVIEHPTLDDIGIRQSAELFRFLEQHRIPCIVLDAADVLGNPRGTLARLCAALGLPFEESMLQWPAGARAEDGVWAKYWYSHVHRSTGFESAGTNDATLRAELEGILAEARTHYKFLSRHALKAA